MTSTSQSTPQQAETELLQDTAVLHYLSADLEKKLQKFKHELRSHKRFFADSTYSSLEQQVVVHEKLLTEVTQQLQTVRVSCQSHSLTTGLQTKRVVIELLHTLSSSIAGLVSATDWQSPSFRQSMQSQAGLKTGKILGNVTDYTRDQHLDGNTYQHQFAEAYLGHWRLQHPLPYLTQSGMAALSTILVFLQREKKMERPIVIGKNSYFQNKELVCQMTTQPIHEVEEHATAKILQVIKEVQPAVIFLDSLCNTHTQACPNLPELLRRLPKICTQETYLVIDNTCLCLGLDPLQFLPKTFHHLKLLVFESLNKYFQFGLDRTTGGIVWGLSADESKLFYARLHAGTNITNTSTLMLPTPNRLLLEQRLARLRRNREYMATRLAKFVHAQKTIIERVVSPCLAIHPAYAWASKYSFAGSNLVLQFKTSKQHPRQYQRFIGKVMTEAKKRSVPLNVGTSFGFDISRVYLTALHTEFGTPFIRISVGTETLPEIETLAQIFEQCILQ